MLSVVIPSYKDPYLQRTIDSLLESAEGEIEVIPVLDGYVEELKEDSRVKAILLEKNRGMRGATNAGIEAAKGEFLMKSDSHCAYGKGFDKGLIGEPHWLTIPRRYSLDEINWTKDEDRPIKDYHYYTFPALTNRYGHGMYSLDWPQRGKQRAEHVIDDTMTFQGSCWFANREYFMEHIGFLDDRREAYGSFAVEQLEVGLKYWLGGGEVKVNKGVWYAHLHKMPRHYKAGMFHKTYKTNKHTMASNVWSAKHWMNDEEPNMIHKLDWLVEKFWPIPCWPENWKEVWKSYNL